MRRKIPSTQSLMCFESAARHQSYTRAAQELALTQSAVSRQITALEEFLEVPLFRRTRHGVELTARGQAYAKVIGPRLQALERDTLDAMSTVAGGQSLHLAAVPTFATRWLIPRLPQFAKVDASVVVHIENRTRPFLFADTEFDAALFTGTEAQVASWSGTRAIKLLREDVVPVCSPALMGKRKELTPTMIATMPLLQQSTRPNAWRQWFDDMRVSAPGALAGPRLELFSMTAEAAAHGMGVALVAPLLIEKELASGELVVACDKPLQGARNYYLVTPEREAPSAALTQFSEWLAAECRSP